MLQNNQVMLKKYAGRQTGKLSVLCITVNTGHLNGAKLKVGCEKTVGNLSFCSHKDVAP